MAAGFTGANSRGRPLLWEFFQNSVEGNQDNGEGRPRCGRIPPRTGLMLSHPSGREPEPRASRRPPLPVRDKGIQEHGGPDLGSIWPAAPGVETSLQIPEKTHEGLVSSPSCREPNVLPARSLGAQHVLAGRTMNLKSQRVGSPDQHGPTELSAMTSTCSIYRLQCGSHVCPLPQGVLLPTSSPETLHSQ